VIVNSYDLEILNIFALDCEIVDLLVNFFEASVGGMSMNCTFLEFSA
jgi:hypothetical protein